MSTGGYNVHQGEDWAKKHGNGKDLPLVVTLDDWLSRDLPDPDFILGRWLTTTSRVLLNAPTGIGKSMFGIRLALSVADGNGFLHRDGVRPARVLYIDGEMARRLLKKRLVDEVERMGQKPKGMFILSHEDIAAFAPLNTPQGQTQIEQVIKDIGGVDFIIFDNVMCLILGDQKDEEGWQKVMPWLRSLTRRQIGQLWVHHTGHDATHGYGTKTREWQMDTVIHFEEVKCDDTDVSFNLSFKKARERTPETRSDFAEAHVMLLHDVWTSSVTGRQTDRGKLTPMAEKFYQALESLATLYAVKVSLAAWKERLFERTLLDREFTNRDRANFSKYRRELIAKNWIVCDEKNAWIVG